MTGAVVAAAIAAAGLVALFVAKQFLGEYLKRSGASAFDRSARWYSRRAKFGRRLVRRYAEVVEQDFTKHAMGFVTDGVIDIDQVYVPLQYERGGTRQDIYENIREQSCSVVIGPAGAGKSMLLKNSMLLWARQARTTRVPVLVELHRCNGSQDTLVDLIVAELARSRVRGGDRIRDVVLRGLQDGAFALLLDGLDEVGRDDLQRVHAALRDLAREYPDCQYIVTCRDVVYQGQPLGPTFAHVVRVAEFDDAAVIRFLGNWRGLSDPVELFTSLRDNPALMRLARSPLLLTMIAYLHTEVLTKSGKRLPTSRPAFYQDAITHLLNRDPDLGRSRSVYHAGEKLAVLQQVALRSMESTGEDRLTLSRRALESTTKKLLPDLNLDDSHVKDLLDEIIDRSQLLVATDRVRTNYTFRHLTLQEYLTAVELADDPDGLLRRYSADPAAWRETVKLWCGATTRDSTKVIAEIFGSAESHHRVLALECLAEATRVDSDFADLVIRHFLDRLGTDDPARHAINTALGAVASDSRPRGNRVRADLAALARAEVLARDDAMSALSASGRPDAAVVLAEEAELHDFARQALRGMGELAIPALVSRSRVDAVWAVDDLAAIGTPAAAEALVGVLWDDTGQVSTRAAWRLADLLARPGIEDQVRRADLPRGAHAEMQWVWQPFASGKDDPLLVVCGRIADIMNNSRIADHSPGWPADLRAVDPRLAIPIAVYGFRRTRPLPFTAVEVIDHIIGQPGLGAGPKQRIRRFLLEQGSGHGPLVSRVCRTIAMSIDVPRSQMRLLALLSWPVQRVLYLMLLEDAGSVSREVRTADWATIRAAQRPTKLLRWASRWVLFPLVGAMLATGVLRSVLTIFEVWPVGSVWAAAISSVVLVAGVLSLWVLGRADARTGRQTGLSIVSALAAIAVACVLSAITLGELTGPLGVLALGVVSAASVACWLVADRWDRIRDNPFRRCFEAEGARIDDRASVVAG
ncbi:NACHT domain-containing protein [Actinokineospora cianjurensis]|uniref:NACHT domain-containing protein n=1 Tax=Actinokineospora cianjurensis TaxID=585224 RepID=UPI0014772F06|nr:NACHT domain-containing protein [Actinokineospora cianjurensis]